MNELNSMQVKTTIVNPQVYIDYLKRHDFEAKEIISVSDNGYGYEWEIRFFDNYGNILIKSFTPIDVIEWLSER